MSKKSPVVSVNQEAESAGEVEMLRSQEFKANLVYMAHSRLARDT